MMSLVRRNSLVVAALSVVLVFGGCSSSESAHTLSDALIVPGAYSLFVEQDWHGDSAGKPSWTQITHYVIAKGSYGGKSNAIVYNERQNWTKIDSISHFLSYESNGDISAVDADANGVPGAQWSRYPVGGGSLALPAYDYTAFDTVRADSVHVHNETTRSYADEERITLQLNLGGNTDFMAKRIHERTVSVATYAKQPSSHDTSIVTADYWFVPQWGWLARDSVHAGSKWTSHQVIGAHLQ